MTSKQPSKGGAADTKHPDQEISGASLKDPPVTPTKEGKSGTKEDKKKDKIKPLAPPGAAADKKGKKEATVKEDATLS